MLSHKPGLGRLSPHFFRLNYYDVLNKALCFPYNKQTSSFGLFHIYACVRVVPCINYIILYYIYLYNITITIYIMYVYVYVYI